MKRSVLVRLGWVWVTGAVGMVGLGREIPTRVHLCVGEFTKRRLTTIVSGFSIRQAYKTAAPAAAAALEHLSQCHR